MSAKRITIMVIISGRNNFMSISKAIVKPEQSFKYGEKGHARGRSARNLHRLYLSTGHLQCFACNNCTIGPSSRFFALSWIAIAPLSRIYSANSPSRPPSPRLKSLNTGGLRSSRLFVIRDPTRRQEEQRHKSPVTHLRVVMCACTWRCPSRSLPTLHTLQLRRLVQLHHAINLPVRVRMVLAGVFLLAVHVYRSDAQIAGLR